MVTLEDIQEYLADGDWRRCGNYNFVYTIKMNMLYLINRIVAKDYK